MCDAVFIAMEATVQVAAGEKDEVFMPMVTDDEGEQYPAVSEEAVKIRRKKLCLDDPNLEHFYGQFEFVSLGACCAVSRGLQYLGLKKHSYPFDWLRSPVEGVIHLLDTDFVDFLTFTEEEGKGESTTIHKGTRWGGSFWHHDPSDPRTLSDFTRRIQRLLGLENVDASQPRCFVRAVNNTLELNATFRLRDALRRSLPSTPFYLVVLVDGQSSSGLFEIAGSESSNLLFVFIDEDAYGDGTRDAAERMLQIYGENYAAAVALALRRFAGDPKVPAPRSVANLSELIDLCEQFHGGDCSNALFAPARFKGQRMRVRDNTPPSLPNLIKARTASFILPATSKPGDTLSFGVFDGNYSITVPMEATPGSTIKLALREGKLFMNVAGQP